MTASFVIDTIKGGGGQGVGGLVSLPSTGHDKELSVGDGRREEGKRGKELRCPEKGLRSWFVAGYWRFATLEEVVE